MESLNKMYFHCLKFHFFAVPFKTCLHAVILLIVFPTTKLAASQLTLTWLQWPLKIFFKQSYKKHLEVYKTHIFPQELELIISLFFIPVKETKPSQYSLCSTVYLTCGDRVVTWRSLGACVSYGLRVHVATPRTWQELEVCGESLPFPRPRCGGNSIRFGRTSICSCSRRNTPCWWFQFCGSWRSASMCGSYRK